jgi:hypothetical protein
MAGINCPQCGNSPLAASMQAQAPAYLWQIHIVITQFRFSTDAFREMKQMHSKTTRTNKYNHSPLFGITRRIGKSMLQPNRRPRKDDRLHTRKASEKHA